MLRRPVLLHAMPLPALILLGVLLLAGGSVTAIQATSTPSFCASCHEMKPYRDAWAKAPHQGVSCVSCHVDPGAIPQLLHKVEALKEVYDHFAADTKFPSGRDIGIPDSRCLACHKDLPRRTKSGFEHAAHVKRGSCVGCHSTVGHNVSPAALAAAGVLATIPPAPHAPASASASATAPAHVKTGCGNCHQLAANKGLPCSTCHVAPHAARGTSCTTCHTPGPRWTFSHPSPATKATCTTCHERPKGHFDGTCSTCHKPSVPFAKTKYAHTTPGTSSTCTLCHRQPAAHVATAYNCASCHARPGATWAFTHPASTSCARCHSAPRNHYGPSCSSCHSPKVAFQKTTYAHVSNSCTTCHGKPAGHVPTAYNCATCHKQPGRSWAFTHVTSAAASCGKCHSQASGHVRTGGYSCTTCHRQPPGRSWAFTHPAATSCQRCHSKPAGHVSTGSTCTTCHKKPPGKSWAFTHPSSTSCASCHRPPSSPPPSHYGPNCSKCHKPSVSFKDAVFSHPSISGPHTSRSYSCATCHPSGPPRVSIPKQGCICHNLGGGWTPGSGFSSGFSRHGS